MLIDYTGDTEASWQIPPTPAAIGATRRRALAEVRAWGLLLPDTYADTIQRVVGELVANAVNHAGRAGPIGISLRLTPRGELAIQVRDGSPAPPNPCAPYNDGTAGRGLAVVAAETIAWGWSGEGPGKRVHATIALPPRRPSDLPTDLHGPPHGLPDEHTARLPTLPRRPRQRPGRPSAS